MKVKVNILGFGEIYCSNNIEYKLYDSGKDYEFYKKGTYIIHNEYGPSWENKNGSYEYRINNELHRLNDYAIYYKIEKYKEYHVIDKCLGTTKENFIKNLANVLIPRF